MNACAGVGGDVGECLDDWHGRGRVEADQFNHFGFVYLSNVL